jgi:3-hydroxyisobutyrate dehydrogenase-like beta-hydroxyacid dehydrogenase
MTQTIGFIGLGIMGQPMARNLLRKGFGLVVYDVVAERARAVVADGAKAAPAPAEVARQADIVVAMLPDFPEVEQAVFGQNGVADAARPELLLINASTMAPGAGRVLAGRVVAAGFRLLEAPVARGIRGAIAGTLCFFVGGGEKDLAAARPVLQAMGSDIYHVGGFGDALALKLVNNALSIATNALIAEATTLGARWGLDRQRMLDILMTSSGDSYALREKLPRMITGDFRPGFAIDLAYKDLSLALQLAAEMNAPLPVVALAREIYGRARAAGLGGQDTSALARLYDAGPR